MIDFSLSFREIIDIYGENPFTTFMFLIKHGGLIIIYPFLVKGLLDGWYDYNTTRVKMTRKFVLLSINVPKENEQSLKAIEQIYNHLYGTRKKPTFAQRWFIGWTQPIFSLEVESNGGYIQFYVRCWIDQQDVVEAAIYAQYPDAEIQEIPEEEDYTNQLQVEMLEDGSHDLYGSEMSLELTDAYPIRHWRGWEHPMPQKFIDPLAAVLEIMSRLGPGENYWFQVLIQPGDRDALNKECEKEMEQFIGKKESIGDNGSSWLDNIIDVPGKIFSAFYNEIFENPETVQKQDNQQDPFARIYLIEWEREAVFELDMKRSRWPFFSKVRFIYWAEKDKYNYEKGRRGFMGALRQFLYINSFKEGKWTQVDLDFSWWWDTFYQPFKQYRLFWRKRNLIWNYKAMDMDRGEHSGFNLSTEELASLYHFPQIDVRAPFIQKAETRRVEPPTQLNFETKTGQQAPNIEFQPDAQSGQPQDDGRVPSPVPHPEEIPTPGTVVIENPPAEQAPAPAPEQPTERPPEQPPSNLPFG